MSTQKKNQKEKADPAKQKTGRVEVIKDGIRIGNFIHAAGSIVDEMDMDEIKIRVDAKEVSLINLN